MAAQFDFESASGDTAADRCRTLWASVLNQAISDAFGDIRRPSVAKSEVDRARSFGLAERGMWARERAEVCPLAGLDPDAFREKVLAMQEAGTMPTRRIKT